VHTESAPLRYYFRTSLGALGLMGYLTCCLRNGTRKGLLHLTRLSCARWRHQHTCWTPSVYYEAFSHRPPTPSHWVYV